MDETVVKIIVIIKSINVNIANKLTGSPTGEIVLLLLTIFNGENNTITIRTDVMIFNIFLNFVELSELVIKII